MMSNEEWDRKVEFILNQQAQFEADMIELKAAQAKTEKSLDRAAQNISHLAGFIHEGFGLTMNLFRESDEKMRELQEAHRLTEEELKRFIAKVDRLTGETGLQT